MGRASRVVCVLLASTLALSTLALWACKPDPYALLLLRIKPGKPVPLRGGHVLTVEDKDGTTFYGVRIEGPASSCEGTMETEASEARLERRASGDGAESSGGTVWLVLKDANVTERCGELRTESRHQRLEISLELFRRLEEGGDRRE